MQKSTKTPNVLIFHHRDLHFVDHLKIESNSYEFLLDTGAELSIITNSLLSSLPLDFSGHTDLACAAKLAIDPVRHMVWSWSCCDPRFYRVKMATLNN